MEVGDNMTKSVKDSIKAGVVPKGKKSAKSKVKLTVDVKVKKEVSSTVTDTVPKLPKEKQAVYITAKASGEAKPVKVKVNDIVATSQQVHVNDIHSANPEIFAKTYYIIMPNTTHVVLRLSEKDYNDFLASPEAKKVKHLYSVVDNAVFPSLTYGSWHLSEIAGELPDADQIMDYDEKFKKMDIHFHNQPVYGKLGFLEEDEMDFDFGEDEEDEIDFSDGDDELTDEEDEFDFSEED